MAGHPTFSLTKRRMVSIAGAALLAGAIGVGVAVAQGSSGSGSSDHSTAREAYITQLAGQLGIDPSKLTDAIRATDLAQINSWVSSGKITAAQGQKLTARINGAEVPPFGARAHPGADRFFRSGGVGDPADLAQFLGTDTTTIKTALKSGQSLAQIAEAHGKTADELETYLVGKAEQKLRDAVASGKITQDQSEALDAKLKAHIDTLINKTHTDGTSNTSSSSDSSNTSSKAA